MTRTRIRAAPVLPDLLAQIPLQQRIDSVTADGIRKARARIPARRRKTKRYLPARFGGRNRLRASQMQLRAGQVAIPQAAGRAHHGQRLRQVG